MIKKILISLLLISVCNNNILPAPEVGLNSVDQFLYAVDLRDLFDQDNLHDRYRDYGSVTDEQKALIGQILQMLGFEESQTINFYLLRPDVQALLVPTKNALYISRDLLKPERHIMLKRQLAYAVIYLQKGLYAPDRLYQAIGHIYCAAEIATAFTLPLFGSKVSYGLSDITQTVHGALGSVCNECGWRALKNSDFGKAISAHVPGLFLAHYMWNMYTYQKCYLEISKITFGLYAKTKDYFWTQVIKNPAEQLMRQKGLSVD